jgi:hypothetical protein
MFRSNRFRLPVLALLCGVIASCSANGPSFDGGLGKRYGGTGAVVEGPAYVPAYRGWRMNYSERQAEKKAIAQDMPFSTVRPSAF